MKKFLNRPWLIGGMLIYHLTTANSSHAQITSDLTVHTEVTSSDQLNFTITGGTKKGGNLFHSFREFSVPIGGAAIFDNALDIGNIFSRVTGGSISNINGLIQTQGNANLFLLNPHGIIFGPGAQLDIRGSFIATTANQINFKDGTVFSASDRPIEPVLTNSIPIGLQFREKMGQIVNQSIVGLQVQPGKTLALIGGDVLIEGGYLSAPRGRIEVGSVAQNSLVNLSPIPEGWALDYQGVTNFRDIQLLQGAVIDPSGDLINKYVSGKIVLQGKNITITDNSIILAVNFGVDQGGSIKIRASDSVEVSHNSAITNSNSGYNTARAGDIIIETGRLSVLDNSFIDASSQTDGPGGNLTVNADQSVVVDGGGGFSKLTTEVYGIGNAGEVKLETGRLIIRDGGQVVSSTLSGSSGNGGSVIINAREFIEISGQGIIEVDNNEEVVRSGVLARSIGSNTTGNGGIININTGNLTLQDGGIISVAATEGSQGQAGNLNIIANSLTLNRGFITAETAKSGANISLQISGILKLENESLISARANNDANGGNININTLFLVAFPPTGPNGSDIIAKAEKGNGGNITIQAQGIFGIAEGIAIPGNMSNDIDASSEFGASGQVQINSTLDPNRGVIELPETVIDPNALIAQNPCKRGTQSQFTRSGRGGLPPSPKQDLSSQATGVRLVEPVEQRMKETVEKESFSPLVAEEIIPAQGWLFNEKGEVVLIAYDPSVTSSSQRLPEKPVTCFVP